jgi:hypothetical protein
MALMADLKAEPKRRGLWAPGHPVEIGGGLPSLIEFWGAQMLPNVIDRAIQVHGALGVTADTPLDKRYREARYARIYGGPDEVHRMVVPRRLLRSPGAAPWSDGRRRCEKRPGAVSKLRGGRAGLIEGGER